MVLVLTAADSARLDAPGKSKSKKREIRTMEAVDGPSARRGVSGGGVCV